MMMGKALSPFTKTSLRWIFH